MEKIFEYSMHNNKGTYREIKYCSRKCTGKAGGRIGGKIAAAKNVKKE